MKNKIYSIFILLSSLSLLFSSCPGENLFIYTVDSVVVSPQAASIVRGNSESFTAVVTGRNNPPQTVSWTVEGGIPETTISNEGVLTVAQAETADSLTVRAISTLDTGKSGTAVVTVTAPAPTVDTVTVSPLTANLEKGATQQFTAEVTGGNNPAQTVIWSVEGGISEISENGLLTIDQAETAGALTVKATSTVDTNKSDTATVNIITTLTPVATPTANPGAGSYASVQNGCHACRKPVSRNLYICTEC